MPPINDIIISETDTICNEEPSVEILFESSGIESSGEEQPISAWSSLETVIEEENIKKKRHIDDLNSPGSGNICSTYIRQSDSSVLRHLYYNYPPLPDPGIFKALLAPKQPIIYPDDGQNLYLHLCSEMNLSPVRLFHKNLLKSVIDLSYYGVNPKGVHAMTIALHYNMYVTTFNLTDNFLNDDCCYHLGEMLAINNKLKELNLNGCRIGESGLRCFGKCLTYNFNLESLNLARNMLGDGGGVVFAKLLSNHANIKKVDLSNNGLGHETAVALKEVFEWRNPFTHLNLSWNKFLDVPSIAKMLNQLTDTRVLQDLNLSFNSLEGKRVASAIHNVLTIPTLTALDLSYNRFQNEAISIIIPGLFKAKKLLTFNLSFNPMSPEDAYNILQVMLSPRVKLQRLLIENICVYKSFTELLDRVLRMKCRKNFKVVYGNILQNWIETGPDPRELLLKRADYLGKLNKKHRIDIPLYFLSLLKESSVPVPPAALLDRMVYDNIPLDEDFLKELAGVFPGPKLRKLRTIDLNQVCDYIHRLWPEKKLPDALPQVEPTQEIVLASKASKIENIKKM